LLLVNANLKEHNIKTFNGSYYDYVPEWYGTVGAQIVKTMLINSIMPYVSLATTILIPYIKRMIDSKDPYKTKKTSMAAFKALWSGGDYVIHFKYSQVLNVTFISMMYGIGMPLLFPIAAFNFFN